MRISDNATVEIFKAAPPASVLGAWAVGISLNEWAAIFAIVYTLLLIAEKLWNLAHKGHHWWRGRKRGK